MVTNKKRKSKASKDKETMNMGLPEDISDEEFLPLIEILLDIKELETPICLMVNRLMKTLLTAKEKEETNEDMIKIIKDFHDKVLDVEGRTLSPVAVIDALTFLMLSLHVYIMDNSIEYRKYSDKLRDTVMKGVYIGEEDFFDPSIR